MSLLGGFGCAFFGALAVRLLGTLALVFAWEREGSPERPKLPAYLFHPAYWLFTVLYSAIGGGVVVLYISSSDAELTPLVAANLGAFWPLLLQGGLRQTPSPLQGKID